MKPARRKGQSRLLARKAEEQARIREIHSALGGSGEAFDRATERPPEEAANLGSRIDAYVKLQTARHVSAPVAEPPEPVVVEPLAPPPEPVVDTPSPVAAEPVVPVAPPARLPTAEPVLVAAPLSVITAAEPPPRRAREPRVEVPRRPSALSRAGAVAAPRIRSAVRLAVHAVVATLRTPPRVLRFVARAALRLLQALFAAVLKFAGGTRRRAQSARRDRARARPARPPRPREERRETERLSPTVLQRVQGYTPRITLAEDAPAAGEQGSEPEPEDEPDASPPPAPRAEAREARRVRMKPRVLLLAAAVAGAAVAAVLVVDRGNSSGSTAQHAAAVRAMADGSAARTSYSNPRSYASAMTRLALANGNTRVAGEPSCAASSTWKQWRCDAKVRPAIGPYAGHWATYRCSPTYRAQAGGAPPTLMVNCRPRTPLPATA